MYASLVSPDLALAPGKRIDALQWRNVSQHALWTELAFDHGVLIRQAIATLGEQVASMRFPAGWLPKDFTIPEMKSLSEAILGRPLDKVTFRRRLETLQILQPVEGEFRLAGAHRPAQVYRMR